MIEPEIEKKSEFARDELLSNEKTKMQRIGWNLMLAGIGFLILAAVCFFQFKNLDYSHPALNTNLLGKWFMIGGAAVYIIGRILQVMGKRSKQK